MIQEISENPKDERIKELLSTSGQLKRNLEDAKFEFTVANAQKRRLEKQISLTVSEELELLGHGQQVMNLNC